MGASRSARVRWLRTLGVIATVVVVLGVADAAGAAVTPAQQQQILTLH